MKYVYVTWNDFCLKSLEEAEARKEDLETKGYTLVSSSHGCITYAPPKSICNRVSRTQNK